MSSLVIICFFTFLIHATESSAYLLRLAGVRAGKIAIALSFVTSTLLVSRLSNMFQAPLLGAMVDSTIMSGSPSSLQLLESQFRLVIFAAFCGSLLGALMGPSTVHLFRLAIDRFAINGSVPKVILHAMKPKSIIKIASVFRFPRLSMLKSISLRSLPKQFLIINVIVTSIYTVGVLCSLLAGAYLPELRATASQLSGIVNGIATILFTIFVDPSGARITDQACRGERPEADVRSVIFFLQLGRLFGTLILAQLLFKPFAIYIMWVTQKIGDVFI